MFPLWPTLGWQLPLEPTFAVCLSRSVDPLVGGAWLRRPVLLGISDQDRPGLSTKPIRGNSSHRLSDDPFVGTLGPQIAFSPRLVVIFPQYDGFFLGPRRGYTGYPFDPQLISRVILRALPTCQSVRIESVASSYCWGDTSSSNHSEIPT